MLLQKQSHIS